MAKLLFTHDTILSADSVEFCPFNAHWIALGTYQKQDDGRIGRISLIDISKNELNVLDVYYTSGILDMKWLHQPLDGLYNLGVVTSTGQLILLKVQDSKFHVQSIYQGDESALLLSLDWSNRQSASSLRCITSSSKGKLSLFSFENSFKLLQEIQAHSYEAWITAFDYWTPDLVYSGGDDGLFKGWDLRLGKSTFVKKFQAGVTSIASHPLKEYILATGSYDETLVCWDTRNMIKPLSEIGMGGGVWRIKWHPYDENLLITACMYNGFRILSNVDTLKIEQSYDSHESIAYGVDWAYNRDRDIFGTCSFYDHVMHVVEYLR